MLKKKIQDDQITALKAGNRDILNILRFILAQIQNKEIEKKAVLSDEETIVVLKKIAKELKESIDAFEKGGRDDLVIKNKKQLEIVSSYLPAEISDEELKKEVDKIIAENKQVFENNPKAIIGICMKSLKSKADPARIMKVLSSFLIPNP